MLSINPWSASPLGTQKCELIPEHFCHRFLQELVWRVSPGAHRNCSSQYHVALKDGRSGTRGRVGGCQERAGEELSPEAPKAGRWGSKTLRKLFNCPETIASNGIRSQ